MLTLYKYTLRPFWIDWSWLYSFVVTDGAVSKVTGVRVRFFQSLLGRVEAAAVVSQCFSE